ncbi:hypothetical protein [Nitrosospira lacus]|uniref:hypothetical protein n=1 Tax=Nitrosospira lacus TaxID=1288494 RepID=UPI0013747EA9|nr:hypothetical protein [Nitrosospira lacus]
MSDPTPQYVNPGNPGPEGGRWYPTLLTLGDGSILAMSGHPSSHDIRHNNNIPERFIPSSGSWVSLSVPPVEFEVIDIPRLYPRATVLPNGWVFCTTPLGSIAQSQVIDPKTGSRRFAAAAPPEDTVTTDPVMPNGVYWGNFFTQCASLVLLPLAPPNYVPRVLICGGNTAYIIDLQRLMDAHPVAAGDPATMATTNPNQQHIFYRGTDADIHHIFWDEATNRLYQDSWTERTGAPAAAGDPATMVTPNQQHVFYRDNNGAVHHIFYDEPTNQLYHDDWSKRTGALAAAGDPATMATAIG